MAKETALDENRKTFEDKTLNSWYTDDKGKVKIGESLAKIMKGDCETVDVRENYYGEPSNTWRIITTNDNRMILLKSSRELK